MRAQLDFVSTWLRCRSTMTACNDRRRRWVDSRSCCPFSGASASARTRNVLSQKGSNSWNGKWPLRWIDLPNYEKFQTQRKPGAKSCLESSASVIPFVRWNRYHRQMYSTSWIDARDNSDQEETSVHKNPWLHILQDGGFIWILMRTEPKFAHAQVVTQPL